MTNNSKIEYLKKRNETILTTIDTLLDIRLTLTVKKLIEKTIKKLDFKKIIDKAKDKLDNMVKNEIDAAFKDYFSINVIDAQDNNKSISLEEMEKSFKDKGEDKGKALNFNNGYFNNNSSDFPNS